MKFQCVRFWLSGVEMLGGCRLRLQTAISLHALRGPVEETLMAAQIQEIR